MKVNKPRTVTETAKKVFEKLAVNTEFSGLEFKALCVADNKALKNVYEDTFMRILRKFYRSQFICISHAKSKYRKIEG